MEKEYRINIATALNSKYLRYAYVLVTSLLENQPDEAEVHAYFLNSDLTERDQEQLETLLASHGGKAHFIHIDRSILPKNCPVSDSWTLEIYYRLLLADIMPEEIDRILYLDVDIVVLHSLKELYFADFEGNLLCACENPEQYPFQDFRDTIFKEQIQNKFRYFNSGVLLINMELLRKNYTFKDYMDTAEKLEFKMRAPDQDLLNYMHWKETKYLPAQRYNQSGRYAYYHGMHYKEIKKMVTVLHFPGDKPWEGDTIHYDIEQLWWDYAKMTPFYEELLEGFMKQSVWSPVIFAAIYQYQEENKKLQKDKKLLQEELGKSVSLCQKLSNLLQEKTDGR